MLVVWRAPEQSCSGVGVGVGLALVCGVAVDDGLPFCELELLDTLHWKAVFCEVSGASEIVIDV